MNFFNSIQKKVPTNPEDCKKLSGLWHGDKCSERAMGAHNNNREALDNFSDKINKNLPQNLPPLQQTTQILNDDEKKEILIKRCKDESGLNDAVGECSLLSNGINYNSCIENNRFTNETNTSVYNACMKGATTEEMKEVRDSKKLPGGKRKKTKRRRRITNGSRSKKRYRKSVRKRK
jgi:hypothetical protein